MMMVVYTIRTPNVVYIGGSSNVRQKMAQITIITGIHMDPIATQEGNYRVYMVVIPNVPVAVTRKIVSQLDICGVKMDMVYETIGVSDVI
jgi:hypothetical protein